MNQEEFRERQLENLWHDLANGNLEAALRHFEDGRLSVRVDEAMEMHYAWTPGTIPGTGVMLFAMRDSMEDEPPYAWGAVRAEGGWLFGIPTTVNELTVKVVRFAKTPERIPTTLFNLGICIP